MAVAFEKYILLGFLENEILDRNLPEIITTIEKLIKLIDNPINIITAITFECHQFWHLI